MKNGHFLSLSLSVTFLCLIGSIDSCRIGCCCRCFPCCCCCSFLIGSPSPFAAPNVPIKLAGLPTKNGGHWATYFFQIFFGHRIRIHWPMRVTFTIVPTCYGPWPVSFQMGLLWALWVPSFIPHSGLSGQIIRGKSLRKVVDHRSVGALRKSTVPIFLLFMSLRQTCYGTQLASEVTQHQN